MRMEVTPEDEELVIRLFVNKNSIETISDKTGYLEESIRSILKNNRTLINKTKRSKSSSNKLLQVVSLYRRGYPIDNIHKILSIGYPIIYSILEENGIYVGSGSFIDTSIQKIRAFAQTVSVGDKYIINVPRDINFDNITGQYSRSIVVTVLNKYSHFVTTNNGDFQYFDLYMGRKV